MSTHTLGASTSTQSSHGDVSASISARPIAGNTGIRAEILRGSRLSCALERWGALWRTSPCDLPAEARKNLWCKSEPCEILDLFISQTWTAPGWQRYVALLMGFYWAPAIGAGLAMLLLLSLVDGLGYMPTVVYPGSTTPGLMWCPWGGVPPAVALVALFFAPKVPGLRNPRVFFDAVCINQADERLMVEGIYSLSGFVAKSRELLILWHPNYFKRAWCVLELAVFTAVNGDGAIRFSPLFVTTTLLVGCVTALVCFSVFVAADYLTVMTDYSVIAGLLKLFVLLPMPVFTHRLRLHFAATRALTTQLEHFSLDDAECRLERDLLFIEQSVVALHGSKEAFDKYVREHLRQRLLASEHHFEFRYVHCFIVMSPATISVVPEMIGLARSHLPLMHTISVCMRLVGVGLWLAPSLVKLLFVISRLFAKQWRNKFANVVISIGIAAMFFLVSGGLSLVNRTLGDRFAYGGYLSCGFSASCALVTFGPTICLPRSPPRAQEQNGATREALPEQLPETP